MKFYASLRGLLRDGIFANSPEYLHKHAGKVLLVRAGPLRRALRIDAAGRAEPVSPEVWAAAQVTIPVARLCGNTDVPLETAGDSGLLRDFAALLDSEDLSTAALAERLFGNYAGSVVENAGQTAHRFCLDARGRLGEQLSDWLTQESGILPDPGASRRLARQVREFAARVENLRQRTLA